MSSGIERREPTSDAAPLLLDRSEGIATITINDPPLNRMTVAFMDELERRVESLRDDRDVRVLVFTGAGTTNFSVGMDLKQLPMAVQTKGSLDAVFDQRLRVLSAIENLGKPSIAVLFGYCLGGGLELPLACHFRIAAEEGCRIGLPELDLGSVPAWGGSARLVRCIGRDAALDMMLRARKISGPEALRLGLVGEVHPLATLEARAREIARELAAMPPIAMAGVLDVAVGAADRTLEESLAAERRAVLATMGTKDQREGMKAFLEKRKPVFTGE
jgi:enoyl-CoA hydratase